VRALAKPTVYLFAVHASRTAGANRRYDLIVWGFFSLAGALHFAATRLRQASCYIAAEPPRGFIQSYRAPRLGQPAGLAYGKVYRRRTEAA
jgi:hypothetical protein